MHFASGSLFTYFHMDYTEKFEEGNVPIPDVDKPLMEKMLMNYTTNYDQFLDTVEKDRFAFRPMGEKVNEYTITNKQTGEEEIFEIYMVTNLLNNLWLISFHSGLLTSFKSYI